MAVAEGVLAETEATAQKAAAEAACVEDKTLSTGSYRRDSDAAEGSRRDASSFDTTLRRGPLTTPTPAGTSLAR